MFSCTLGMHRLYIEHLIMVVFLLMFVFTRNKRNNTLLGISAVHWFSMTTAPFHSEEEKFWRYQMHNQKP
jgi:hypothetical protein